MTNEQLTKFIVGIVDEKGLALDSDVKSQLVEDMSHKLLDLIEREMVASLSDKDVDRLNQLLDEGASDESIQQFMTTSVPDASNIVASVAARFRQMYLGAGR